MKKSILVTGSKGFTGKTLVKMLCKKNYKVLELDCDISKKKHLEDRLKNVNFEYVIHMAAISNVEYYDASIINKVNIQGTRNVLSIINNMIDLPKLVIIPSSAYVYGVSKNGILNENSKLDPLNSYGKSKLEMENLCEDFQNLSILITRPFNYTGCDQELSFLIPKIIHHFKLRKEEIILGNLNVKREFNDVRDVCKIYIKLIENVNFSDKVNICSGKSHSIKKIIKICEKLTGHNINVKISEDLKRKREISNIIGDPKKMNSMIGNHIFHTLEDTLKSMLYN
jgi:nucleoside-diphosphate-sugar epimerase